MLLSLKKQGNSYMIPTTWINWENILSLISQFQMCNYYDSTYIKNLEQTNS